MKELVDILNVSEATIRRDLQQMEDLHMIVRYHGGASIKFIQSNESSLILKNTLNEDGKTKIAKFAASLIKDNQIIYMDAGSFTYKLLDYLSPNKKITVITIGVHQAIKLIDKGINTIVLGGQIRRSSAAITGVQTLKQLDNLFFDLAFVGVNGIHEKVGFTTSNEQEAEVKRKVISHSSKTYLLADNSKFNKLLPIKFADLNQCIVITDTIDTFDKKLLNYILIN